MTENVPKLMSNPKPQIQENTRLEYMPKNYTKAYHIIIKDKQKVMKEKEKILYLLRSKDIHYTQLLKNHARTNRMN